VLQLKVGIDSHPIHCFKRLTHLSQWILYEPFICRLFAYQCCVLAAPGGPSRRSDGSIVVYNGNNTAAEEEADYCTHNTGDWRYIPCTDKYAIYINGTFPDRCSPVGQDDNQTETSVF
jgi:hypothetical protein